MSNSSNSRRSFIKKSAVGAAGLALGVSAKSYANIIGANERINVAILGCNRRFGALAEPLSLFKDVSITYVGDVDSRRQDRAVGEVNKMAGTAPKGEKDLRKILEDNTVDAVFHATPDHWHAPGTWMSLQADKHVYVEKPCSHNPREGELLIALQKKHNKVVQMGAQQRSAPESQEIIQEIHKGTIGEVFHAVAFYSNSRGEVPAASNAPVPEWLDWELFQGPAPRAEFIDILGDYMWHWYWAYGTAETGNNATHELDVSRWALQVQYPEEVKVNAGKYHFKNDPWTMYDTMDVTFNFPGGKSIRWDGKSRDGYNTYGSGRGSIIYGSEGSVYVDRDGYRLYDRAGKMLREKKASTNEGSVGLGGGGGMTVQHINNFLETIRGKATLNCPIDEGAISTHLCHYANISYKLGNRNLKIDPKTGRFLDKKVMKQHWGREYEKGWEPPKVD